MNLSWYKIDFITQEITLKCSNLSLFGRTSEMQRKLTNHPVAGKMQFHFTPQMFTASWIHTQHFAKKLILLKILWSLPVWMSSRKHADTAKKSSNSWKRRNKNNSCQEQWKQWYQSKQQIRGVFSVASFRPKVFLWNMEIFEKIHPNLSGSKNHTMRRLPFNIFSLFLHHAI